MTDDANQIRFLELSGNDLESAIRTCVCRLVRGHFESAEAIAALRVSQTQFAQVMGISVHTLRNWEQDRSKPEGPRSPSHPRILHENRESTT